MEGGEMGAMESRPWLRHYEAGIPASLEYPEVPLHRLLEGSARRFPEVAATLFFGARLSYAELSAQVDRFAGALAGLGVQKGERVALLLPNCPQDIIAYYGALKAGAIVVPTNPLYSERELEHQLADSGAVAIVTLSKFYPAVQSVQPRTALSHVVVTYIKEYFPPLLRLLFALFREKKEGHAPPIAAEGGTILWRELMAGARPLKEAPAVSPGDMALLQYTGGTTGVAKGAMLSHHNLVANCLQVSRWLTDLKEGKEVLLAALPFFHVYGMTVAMNLAIYIGATLVLLPRFEVEEVLKSIARYRPTIFPGVPTMYVAINNAPQVQRHNLRSIRACISGAAPLPVEVQRRFEELTGARLVEGYGLTEAAPVTHCNPIYGLRKVGTIGVPIPDVEARVVDLESGESTLPPGEEGELAVRGPNVMEGYWKMPEETAQVLRDGWLYTGDIAKMDEDGYFAIVERKKDMIIAGGFNIYPRDVEEVAYQHLKVKEAVAVGVPDPYRGETVKLFVVLKEGETATEEEIIEFCRGKMAKYKVPTAVEFRQSLPKTLVGKFLRRALLEEEKRRMGTSSA